MMLKYGTLRDSKKRKKVSKKKALSPVAHYLRWHQLASESCDEGDEDELGEAVAVESYFSSGFKAVSVRPDFYLQARRPVAMVLGRCHLGQGLKVRKQFL